MTASADAAGASSRYRIEHVTRFVYTEPVRRCTMSLCLRPIEAPGQRLLDFSVKTTPTTRLTTENDPFGNTRHILTLHQDHDILEVVSTSEVAMEPPPALPERLGKSTWDETRALGVDPKWWDFTGSSPLARASPALSDFVAQMGVAPRDDPLVDLMALSDALNDAFEYQPGVTSVDSTIDEFLASGKGVCQDYTHVMVAIARSWGVPTRYVSGYLYVTADGPVQPGSAFGAATHAWAETRLPHLGWIGLDPTNRSLADQKYVRIAVGRDYRDVPPTRGVIEGGGESQLEVDVRMTLL